MLRQLAKGGRNNPIPGAIWRNAPGSPVLVNGDEMMPADYDLET